MTTTFILSTGVGDTYDNSIHYRSVGRALQYITITRPDLTYVVNKVYQLMACPLVPHWLNMKRILIYLCGTSTHRLVFKPSPQLYLHGFLDVVWGYDPDHRISTLRVMVYFGLNLVTWLSRKPHSISKSST